MSRGGASQRARSRRVGHDTSREPPRLAMPIRGKSLEPGFFIYPVGYTLESSIILTYLIITHLRWLRASTTAARQRQTSHAVQLSQSGRMRHRRSSAYAVARRFPPRRSVTTLTSRQRARHFEQRHWPIIVAQEASFTGTPRRIWGL